MSRQPRPNLSGAKGTGCFSATTPVRCSSSDRLDAVTVLPENRSFHPPVPSRSIRDSRLTVQILRGSLSTTTGDLTFSRNCTERRAEAILLPPLYVRPNDTEGATKQALMRRIRGRGNEPSRGTSVEGSPIIIRRATREDQARIRAIVLAAGINPFSLNWQRFLVAEEHGRIVAVGQIKPHGDGSHELASIAVIRERRGQGLGSAIVQALLASHPGPLYLMCERRLERYYTRFGFRLIGRDEMPPYFRRIHRLAQLPRLVASLFGQDGPQLSVMQRGA